ncbi:uncharacterized protein LOC124934404 [Impatiens glandulifera]|uniref:uncharacterized protein LOC124934404 n=1 Tax=Impatiens glandulifera TaxID=253017 RepID=UPI001FB0B98F|nr:uncharacterized protein LOC124934404 [Impatiens glandulifera]
MDVLSFIAPSILLPTGNHHFQQPLRRLRLVSLSSNRKLHHRIYTSRRRRFVEVSCRTGSGETDGHEDHHREEDEIEKALSMDGTIPGTSDEFVKRVSSHAYDLRRRFQQTFDSSSYDVLETNPWMDSGKAVYILTQKENQLCTMKTRRNRSEVERELGLLFSKGGELRSGKQSRAGGRTDFQMLVEDVTEGVLVFEDEMDAARYCDLLQGGGGCEGVAEIEAASVFDLCQKMKALAVLFRRGRTPPLPESLKLNLRARKRSLEDDQD